MCCTNIWHTINRKEITKAWIMSFPSRMNDSGARLVLLPNPNAWVVCFNSITVKPHSAPPAATHQPANAPAHCGQAGGTQKLLVLPRGSPALCFTGQIRRWVRLENTFRRQHLNEHIYPIYVGSSFLTLRSGCALGGASRGQARCDKRHPIVCEEERQQLLLLHLRGGHSRVQVRDRKSVV